MALCQQVKRQKNISKYFKESKPPWEFGILLGILLPKGAFL